MGKKEGHLDFDMTILHIEIEKRIESRRREEKTREEKRREEEDT